MNAVLGAAEAREEPLIGAVAMPTEFLTRFGFHPGEKFSIAPSVGGWTPYFLVRPLTGYTDSLRGIFYFPEAFGT
jgi:putative acetyltransferase